MRPLILAFLLSVGALPPASAQLSIGIGIRTPGVSLSVNLPVYPDLVLIPGYPVYYAPGLGVNFFFYDGFYWLFEDGYWYASSWYNGPWEWVAPIDVPIFILRVPVRYYRIPPPAFVHWRRNEPPRWGAYWGHDWEQHRRGWEKWDRRSAPTPAPLPLYQRSYSGPRYPRVEQQRQLHQERYRYQPRDDQVREHYREQEQERAEPRPQAPYPQRDWSGPGRQRDADPHDSPRGMAAPQRQRDEMQRRAPSQQAPEFQRRHDPQEPRPQRREFQREYQPREFQREMPSHGRGQGPSREREERQRPRGRD